MLNATCFRSIALSSTRAAPRGMRWIVASARQRRSCHIGTDEVVASLFLARGLLEPHVLRPRSADRIVEELEQHVIPDREVPVFAVHIALVEENAAIRRTDRAARLTADELLDAARRLLS